MNRLFVFFLLLVAVGCTKPARETDTTDRQQRSEGTLGNLTISAVSAPAAASLEGNIVANVRCTGPNLCYRFIAFEVKETAAREYDIRAKGNVPGPDAVCAQAVYVTDTTVHVKPTTAGLYTLRFYNGTALFKTETVQVN